MSLIQEHSHGALSLAEALACFNVLGHCLTPGLLVRREGGLKPEFMQGCGTLGAAMAKTESHLQNQESLLVWLDWFAKETKAHPATNVQLLKIDGHSSRYCSAVRERARALGVEMFKLVGHTTSRMCEVDTHLAAPFKRRVSFAYTLECCRHMVHGDEHVAVLAAQQRAHARPAPRRHHHVQLDARAVWLQEAALSVHLLHEL
jgi:hypothetical protein